MFLCMWPTRRMSVLKSPTSSFSKDFDLVIDNWDEWEVNRK